MTSRWTRFWNAPSVKNCAVFSMACVLLACAATATAACAASRGWIAIAATMLLLLAAGSLGLLLRLVGPVGELTRTASRLGAGDYDARANVARDDEMGALGRALNGLAGHLASHGTERRDAEEQLQTLALFLDEDVYPVMRISKEGAFLYANRTAVESPSAWHCAAGAPAPAELSAEVQKALNAGAPHESKFRCGDRMYSFAFIPVAERGYVNLYGRDITESERTKEALAQARDEMEQRVQERTARLVAANKSLQADIEARKRVENALRESQERFRMVMENSPATVSILDRNLVYRWVLNPSPPYTPEDYIGRPLGSRDATPELTERHNRLARGVLETGRPVRFESENRLGDAAHHFEVTYQPWRDGDGNVIGVAVYAHDITERKKTEEALRISESLLRAITDNSHDPIYLKDRECRVLFANPASLAMVAKPFDQVVGKKDQEFHDDPETARVITENDQRIMNSDKAETVEETIRGRIYLSTKAPYHDAAGRVIGLVGTSHDITDRKRIEEALRESREHFRLLMENSPDSFMIVDRDLIFRWVMNPTAPLTSQGLFGEPLGCFAATPEDAEQRRGLARSVLESGQAVRFEAENRIGGAGHYYEFTYQPWRDGEGKTIGVAIYAHDITKRKQAEEALRESETRFRSLFNDAPIGMAIFSADNRFLQANRAHCEFLGCSEQELSGKSILDVTYPEDREETVKLMRQAQEGGPPVARYLKRYLRKDGKVVWGEVSVSHITDAHGGFRYGIAQIADVTERRRADEALRRANAYNRSLIEASVDPLVTIGRDGKITDVNHATEAATGCVRSALIGADFSDYFTEPEKARAGYQQVFREGIVRDYPLELRHRDGRVTSVLYNASVYRDDSGNVAGVFAVARDITKRKQAEQALRESEERYRDLFEVSPAALIEEDWACVQQRSSQARAEGASDVRAWFLSHPEEALLCFRNIERLDVNKTALRLFKASDKRELLENYSRLGCEESRDTTIRAIGAMAAGDEFFEAETSLQTLTGEKRNLLMSISAAPIAEKSPARYIVSLSDVTELRKAQQEAMEQRQNAQLQRMESLAVTGRLAAGVAHEINNPLQGIVAQLTLLAGELPEPLRKGRRIELIHGGIDRIAGIVRNLLQLHRAPPVGEESCAASSVVPSLADMISSLAANQRIKLEVAVSPPDMEIPMSANALTQVLLNLALNAIDAMPKGGVIQINARRDGEGASVSVSDTGVGIPVECRTQIFSPFFTTKGPKGTGLGLSVTYSLVTSAGGSITVSDRAGGGTTFTIRFVN